VSFACVRGLSLKSGLLRPSERVLGSRSARVSVYDRCTSASEALMRYYGGSRSARRFVVVEEAAGVGPALTRAGEVGGGGVGDGGGGGPYAKSARDFPNQLLPALATLSNDPGVAHSIRALQEGTLKLSRRSVQRFRDAGLGEDEQEDLDEGLTAMLRLYE
jgi:hypothetical protein